MLSSQKAAFEENSNERHVIEQIVNLFFSRKVTISDLQEAFGRLASV